MSATMDTTTTRTEIPRPEATRAAVTLAAATRSSRLVASVVAALVAVSASVAAASAVGGGGSKAAIVIPVGTAVGLALALLAAVRFDLFVATVLLIRASLDVAKLGSSSIDAPGAISGLFIVMGLLWLIEQRADEPAERSPLVAPVVALAAAGVLSTLFAPSWVASGVETIRIATVAVILAVLNRLLIDWRRIRLVLVAVFASSIVPVLVGLYQVTGGTGRFLSSGLKRIDGTFVHPNPFAFYLFLLIILGAALFPYVSRRARPVLVVLLVAWSGLLLMTYARGALISAVVGLVIIGVLRDRRWIPAIVVATIVMVVLVPSITTRFSDLAHGTTPSGAAANSLEWRFRYWHEVLSLQSNPVFGIGLRAVEMDTKASKAPHNDFIRVYVETGLIGLGAYLWLLWALFRTTRRALARTTGGPARALALALAASAVGFVLLSATGNIISQLVILWYFGAIASTALAASRLSERPALLV